jgi:hypothetical protein
MQHYLRKLGVDAHLSRMVDWVEFCQLLDCNAAEARVISDALVSAGFVRRVKASNGEQYLWVLGVGPPLTEA